MFDHNVLVAAGLKPRHVSRIVGVSRVTASNWLRGIAKPHKLLEEKANALHDAAATGIENGELPVSATLPPEEVSVRTVAVIMRLLKSLEESETNS